MSDKDKPRRGGFQRVKVRGESESKRLVATLANGLLSEGWTAEEQAAWTASPPTPTS